MAEEDAAASAVARVVQAVLRGIDVEGRLEVTTPEEDALLAHVQTDEPEHVIGRGGQVINALQYLAVQAAHRAERPTRRRVVVDVNDYRRRRTEALENLAHRAAEEAVTHQEEIELDPMSPAERRIIHMALKDHATVVTRSEGDEPRRRVIVEPA
jgi:spoIIIJ-associated protein